ncbi:putative ribosomal protein L28/L24 [Helianthus annuus]|nr:putative ribosomal protein L28/L24 [Helianthus annuus]KAJ0784857.1 putative ribosomal protein L28/L24 [Helianthus annuus]KAJ0794124.1 putative ribosomal protein L28/L24 [Helianthus annuus]
MDTEMGLLWKSKIEKMYQELGNMEVVFFPQEEENKLAEEFKEMRIEQRVARRDARRIAYGWSPKVAQIEEASEDGEANHHEELVANS